MGSTEAEEKLVSAWRSIWKRAAVLGEILSPQFVYHYHGEDLVGCKRFAEFVGHVASRVRGLNLVPVEVLSREDRTLLYYYWEASHWGRLSPVEVSTPWAVPGGQTPA